jgi:cytochrome c556
MRLASLPRLSIVLLGLTLVACDSAAPPDTFPGQPVTERNKIFKQMLRAFEPIGLMARGKEPFAANKAVANATELKRLSTLPWSHFPAGSDYAPTKAKAGIWEKPTEFKRAQDEFVAAADKLASAAQARDLETLQPAYEAVHQSCSSCHKAFRR